MAELHLDNCDCTSCRVWFYAAKALSGRCRQCAEPIDRHTLSPSGDILTCPRTKMHA